MSEKKIFHVEIVSEKDGGSIRKIDCENLSLIETIGLLTVLKLEYEKDYLESVEKVEGPALHAEGRPERVE